MKIPEEPGYRLEILEGFLVKGPSPSLHHQRVPRELVRQLMTFFDGFDPEGELFFAPLDVTLTISNVLQPDMEIYRKARIPHCWLVDPEENTLEAFMLKDESYALVIAGGPGDKFTHPDFSGLDLDLTKVFHRSVL